MIRALVTAAALVVATAAFAEGLDLATVDTDANGAVSMEELKVAMPDVTEDAFKAADKDASGDLNAEELATVGM